LEKEKNGRNLFAYTGTIISGGDPHMDTKKVVPQQSRTDAAQVRQQNQQSAQGTSQAFGTEFASETNAQQVRRQNQQSAQGANKAYSTEFASETNVQQVRQQNAQAERNKNKQSGQF
jgi:small acid-soluble spore protein E (minor gamma-type SASP)